VQRKGGAAEKSSLHNVDPTDADSWDVLGESHVFLEESLSGVWHLPV
jgi:hypothetical protein